MGAHGTASKEPARSVFKLMRFKKRRPGVSAYVGTKKTISTMERIESAAKIITNISIIFGLFTTGITLLHAQQEKSIDRTIDYRKDFNTQYIDRFNALANRFDDMFDSDPAQKSNTKSAITPMHEKQGSIPASRTESKQDIFYGPDQCRKRDMIISFFSDKQNKQNRHDFGDIIDFYDYLWTCVRNHSCDRNASIELFQADAKELFHKYAFYIFWEQKDSHDELFGEGLESISKLDHEWFLYRMLPELNLSMPVRAKNKGC